MFCLKFLHTGTGGISGLEVFPCNVLNVRNSLFKLCRTHEMNWEVFPPPLLSEKVCVILVLFLL